VEIGVDQKITKVLTLYQMRHKMANILIVSSVSDENSTTNQIFYSKESAVKYLLTKLTDQERYNLIHDYCVRCGAVNCNCGRPK